MDKYNIKTCNKCKRNLPADLEHFHRNNSAKSGLDGRCKECKGSTFGIHYVNRAYRAKEGHMFCGKCRKELPLDHSHFYRHKQAKNGWGSQCKICWGAKEYGVTHINVTYKAEKGHKFCATCKEQKTYSNFYKSNEIKDGYSPNCAICSRARGKEYNSLPENKIKRAKRFKAWRKKFYATEAGRMMNQKHLNLRRSRKASTVYNYSEDIWIETLKHFKYSCAYCGEKESNLNQEHVIPLSKGGYYTKQNIIPACTYCNSSKHNKDLEEWYPKFAHYSKERHDKVNKWIGVKDNNQQLALF